jgi:hypothetical protein
MFEMATPCHRSGIPPKGLRVDRLAMPPALRTTDCSKQAGSKRECDRPPMAKLVILPVFQERRLSPTFGLPSRSATLSAFGRPPNGRQWSRLGRKAGTRESVVRERTLLGVLQTGAFPPFCEVGAAWMPKMGTKACGRSVCPRPDWRRLASTTEIAPIAERRLFRGSADDASFRLAKRSGRFMLRPVGANPDRIARPC